MPKNCQKDDSSSSSSSESSSDEEYDSYCEEKKHEEHTKSDDYLRIESDPQRYRQALEWIISFADYVVLDNETQTLLFATEYAQRAFVRATYYPCNAEGLKIRWVLGWVVKSWSKLREDYRKLRHCCKYWIEFFLFQLLVINKAIK